ncbi:LOW QUALITY PROTEIN: hypothetical protein KUTeg_015818, partial [Tegillarca granosa]
MNGEILPDAFKSIQKFAKMDDDESADDMKKKSCSKLCIRFADKTSMQGVPYINNARLWYAKAAWVFLLLVAIGVMAAHLWYLCDQFFDWPKLTKITLGFDNLLTLYMENEEYLEGITQGHGARISISNKNEIPFPADDGISISPYKDHDIALRLVDITRLSHPYGDCEDGEAFKTRYKKEYTRRKENVFTDEKQYMKTLSSIDWPTAAYSGILRKAICDIGNCDKVTESTDSEFMSNLIKINIYFEDLNYETIEETPEIENAQFLSDVGGAIGLWIGLSIMFEIIQLLLELCHFGCYKCNHGNDSETKNKNKKSRERSYKQQNQDGFYRQTFTQDMNSKEKYNERNKSIWQNGSLATNTPNKDSFVNGESYLPETQYSNLGDYQHIGEYYMYKGKQNYSLTTFGVFLLS